MTSIFNIKEINDQQVILEDRHGKKLTIDSFFLPDNLNINEEILIHIEKNTQENEKDLAKKILNIALNPEK